MVVGTCTGALVKASAVDSEIRASSAQNGKIPTRPAVCWAASREHRVARPGATVIRPRLGEGSVDSEPSRTACGAVPLERSDRYIRW